MKIFQNLHEIIILRLIHESAGEVISKFLNTKIKLLNEELNIIIQLYKWAPFLIEKNNEINNIWGEVIIIFKKNKKIFKKINLNIEDIEILLSFFVLVAFINKKDDADNDFHDYFIKSDKIIHLIQILCNNYEIYNNLKLTPKIEIFKMCLKIFTILESHGIILSRTSDVIIKNELKTWKYYAINNLNYININFNIFNFSVIKYEIFVYNNCYFLKTNSFFSLIELFVDNKYSNNKFVLNNVNFIKDLLEISFNIDWVLFHDNLKFITSELSLDEEIKKIYLQINSLNKSKYINYKIYLNNQHILAKFKKKKIIFNIKKLEIFGINNIFIPIIFDFRGRLYYNSEVSPTNTKFLRYCIYYTNYSKIPHNYFYAESESFIRLSQKYNANSPKYKNRLFWILIALSNVIILKKEKISVVEFIEKAELFLNNPYLFDKEESNIAINYYSYLLNNLNFNKNYPIQKDATASVIQNLIWLLGAKNENSLIITNLMSENTWYDTYTIIITDFLLHFKNEITNIELFNRKTLKKMIMTIPYASTFPTCLKYFKKEINVKIDESILDDFKKFYFFLKSLYAENTLFNANSDKMYEYLINNNFIIHDKEETANLIYYVEEKIDINTHVNKIRKTGKYARLSEKIDKKKIKFSHKANWIHFLDALFLRTLIKNLNLKNLTIHDCILCEIDIIYNIIIEANKIYDSKLIIRFHHKNEIIKINRKFSLFILL